MKKELKELSMQALQKLEALEEVYAAYQELQFYPSGDMTLKMRAECNRKMSRMIKELVVLRNELEASGCMYASSKIKQAMDNWMSTGRYDVQLAAAK